MKKIVGVLSLMVMVLTQIVTPYAYAVGDVSPVDEVVTEEVVVEEPMMLEPIEDEEIIEENAPTESENTVEEEIVSGNKEETNTEIPEEQTEEITSGNNEVFSGSEENQKEETESLSGAESSSGFFETVKEGVKNLLGIGENEEIIESVEIYGTGEYAGVKVEVYAQTGLFESGTVLTIEPVIEEKLEQVKEVLSGEVEMVEEEEEQTVIAFDITFRDPETQEELQPKNGTVQVTFNYEENENLVQAEEKEEQEVKVYHLNDIDEEGNKIEELTGTIVEEVVVNEEESEEENKIVVEAEKFSVYTIVKQVKEEQLISFQYGMISIANPSNSNYGITIMDRNLGATMTGVGSLAPKESYGYHYQWGNNYGFDSMLEPSQIIKSDSQVDVSSLSEYSSSTFITSNSSWMTSYKNLWGAGGQGPCPDGWHVPTYYEWSNLYNYYNNTYTNSGVEGFLNYFYFPFAGHRDRSSATFYGQTSYGDYWSSTYYFNNTYAYTVNFRSNYVKINDYYGFSNALPVRCFKNSYEGKSSFKKVYFNLYGGKGLVSMIDVLYGEKISKPLDPTRDNSIFLGWFLSGSNIEFNFENEEITEDITIYAKWGCVDGYTLVNNSCSNERYLLTYDANGGKFDDGENTKYHSYRRTNHEIKYSHTSNVNLSGEKVSDYNIHNGNDVKTEVITIPGAEKLFITIIYGSASSTADYVSMWTGSHPEYTAQNNYTTSVTGKLGGGNYTDSSNRREYVIVGDTVTFSFTCDYSYYGGAKYGYYAVIEGMTSVADESNIDIEPPIREGYEFLGRYQESIPEYFNFSKGIDGDTTLYANWRKIDGGDLSNMDSTLLSGKKFNKIIKTLANGSVVTSETTSDGLILDIKKAEWIPKGIDENQVAIISTDDSTIPIYAWFAAGVIYYYTEAGIIYMNEDSSYMFSYLKSLTNINLSGFDSSFVINMSYMFYYSSNLREIFNDFDTSSVTNMEYMFIGCNQLNNLDVSNWNTSSVTKMNYMFYNCSNLSNLDVSNWNTSSVTNMNYMFYNCSKLENLDVSNWNTSSVTNMSSMFYGSNKLTSLDVSNWNTSSVTNMSSMFYNCSKLENLDVSNWNTSNVTNMSYMFYGCSSLTNLDVSNFDTSNVTSMYQMFYNCSKLENLDVSNFDTSNVTSMYQMFYGCSSLTNLDVSNFDTSNVTNMGYMFYNCSSLTNLDVSNFNTNNVTDMSYMFYGCSSLTNLDISNFDTSNVENMGYMFYGCSSLTNLDVSNFDTSNVTNMGYMFYNCSSLTNLNVSNWNTSSVTSMGSMFYNCSNLNSLDLSNFDTKMVDNMGSMFYNSSNLKKIYVSDTFTTRAVSSSYSYSMFYGLTEIEGGNGTRYDGNKTDITYARIDNEYQSGYFTRSGFVNTDLVAYLAQGYSFNQTIKSLAVGSSIYSTDTVDSQITGFQRAYEIPSGVETEIISDTASDVPVYAWYNNGIIYYYTQANRIDLNRYSNYMFANLVSLQSIDLLDFDPSSIYSMYYMFQNCRGLREINLSGWDTRNVYSMYNMFDGCENLEKVDLSNWDVGNVGNGNYMFKGCTNLTDLKLDGWRFKRSGGIYSLLENCPIKKISMKGWKIPGNFSYGVNNLFYNISTLEEIDVSNRDLSKTEDIHELFYNTKIKRIVGVKTWKGTEKLKDLSYMFDYMPYLEEVDMSDMDLSKVTNIYELFMSDYNLKKINMSNIKFSNKLENIAYLCQNCSSLEEIDLSNWNIDMPDTISYATYALFQNSYNLKNVNLHNFGKVTSTYAMFQNNYSLTGLDLSGLDTSNAKTMDYMFYGSTGFRELNLTTLDTSKVTNMNLMFYKTENLKTIYASEKFNTNNVETSTEMFSGAISLVGGNGTRYDPDNVDVTYARIDNEYQSGYFTDPNHFAVKFLTITGEEIGKQWISSGSTAAELEDSHRDYRYYTSGDLQTRFDFTEPLYGYTEIFVTWDDVHYVSYEYGTGVEEGMIYTGSCIAENGDDRENKLDSCEVVLPEISNLTGYNTPLWYKKGEEITYPNLIITLTGDEELEAIAEANHYTIIFNPGEGTGEMEPQEFVYNVEGLLNSNVYTKKGYHFTGWVDEDLNGYKNKERILNLITTGSIEFIAQWEIDAPSAGGGRAIQQQVKEEEHNVAEEKEEENKVEQEEKEEIETPEETETKTTQETTQTNTNSTTSTQSTPVTKEVQTAYEWAYSQDVTTMPTLEIAMPEGVVKRGHLAKMVVNYAVNVLGYTIPEKIPSECRWNDNKKDWESEEIKDYAVKSCALGLMGLDMSKFLPNMEVTRAQFGTIMSRLLWGKKYAGGTPYYRKHLNALKENNIMTQIENPERRVELRQWVWLMLMRSAEDK